MQATTSARAAARAATSTPPRAAPSAAPSASPSAASAPAPGKPHDYALTEHNDRELTWLFAAARGSAFAEAALRDLAYAADARALAAPGAAAAFFEVAPDESAALWAPTGVLANACARLLEALRLHAETLRAAQRAGSLGLVSFAGAPGLARRGARAELRPAPAFGSFASEGAKCALAGCAKHEGSFAASLRVFEAAAARVEALGAAQPALESPYDAIVDTLFNAELLREALVASTPGAPVRFNAQGHAILPAELAKLTRALGLDGDDGPIVATRCAPTPLRALAHDAAERFADAPGGSVAWGRVLDAAVAGDGAALAGALVPDAAAVFDADAGARAGAPFCLTRLRAGSAIVAGTAWSAAASGAASGEPPPRPPPLLPAAARSLLHVLELLVAVEAGELVVTLPREVTPLGWEAGGGGAFSMLRFYSAAPAAGLFAVLLAECVGGGVGAAAVPSRDRRGGAHRSLGAARLALRALALAAALEAAVEDEALALADAVVEAGDADALAQAHGASLGAKLLGAMAGGAPGGGAACAQIEALVAAAARGGPAGARTAAASFRHAARTSATPVLSAILKREPIDVLLEVASGLRGQAHAPAPPRSPPTRRCARGAHWSCACSAACCAVTAALEGATAALRSGTVRPPGCECAAPLT